MATIRRLVLDVLKPHQPSAIVFASTLADCSADYWVNLDVTEMDEKTETTVITIEGENILFEELAEAIERMGGSIHSIDEVDVIGSEQR